jgi:predicted permease
MSWAGESWRRLRMWLSRGKLERELAEEMQLHLELAERDARARGEAPGTARRRFGNRALAAEESREAWGWRRLDELAGDLRYALRTMRRGPGFTLACVLALALGIGANTAIFSVVDAVLLRPLPYADSGRLVTILSRGHLPVAPRTYLDWQEQSRSFAAMGAAEAFGPNLAGIERPEQVTAMRLTPEVLPMLGVAPLLGRVPVAGDGPGVVVLSHGLWTRRFGADPGAIGREVRLDGTSHTVVGVMPPGFQFAPFWVTGAELWAPLDFGEDAASRKRSSLRVFGRLAGGVSLEDARAEMAGIGARLDAEFPGTSRDVQVVPLHEKVVGGVRPALLVLLGAVGLVLLIACANVAHLLLARAAARQRELAIRAALGAGRGRLARQLLTESLLLALLGGAAGLGLAALAVDAVVALRPGDLPRVAGIGIDGRVLGVTLAVSLLAGLAFGVLPALTSLRPGARPGRGHGLRGALVGSQVALSLVLAVGAGLMIRSVVKLGAIEPGWDPRGVVSMVVSVAGAERGAPGKRAELFRALVEDVRAVPGVTAASAINHLPLGGDVWMFPIAIEGRPRAAPGEQPHAVYRVVLPGYFATMRQPLLAGRDVAPGDTLDAAPVVVVNRRLAELHFGGDALGARLAVGEDGLATIVGVVADARQDDWTTPARAEVYLPYLQTRAALEDPSSHRAYLTLVARASTDSASLAATVRARVAALDPGVTVSHVATMEEVVAREHARPRFLLAVLGAFAGASLLLSAIGIYGVVSHAVARRRHEIGIRVALGATRGRVMRMVLREGLTPVIAGVLAGVAGALALARLLAGLLYGVGATDPVTFVAVAALLAAVAAAACLVPARRAARVDPMTALRQD